MRFVLILGLLLSGTARAQEINADEVVRNARAERARARCLLRAAGRSERLAARYRRARGSSARSRLGAQIEAVDAEKQACMRNVDSEFGASIGTGTPSVPRAHAPHHVVVRSHIASSPTDDIRELRRMWALSRGRLRRCVQRAFNVDPTPFEEFAVRYVVTAEGRVNTLEGVPARLESCLAFLLRERHPEAAWGMNVRIVIRARLEERAVRDATAVDFPNRAER
ncbi:MAG: hypothetical protein AB8H86_20290 [Polyangiales bacterium]